MNNFPSLHALAQMMLYLPFSMVIGTALLAWLFGTGHPKGTERWLGWLTLVLSFLLLMVAILMMLNGQRDDHFIVLGLGFRLDALSIFMILLINIVAFATSGNVIAYLEASPSNLRAPWWRQGRWFHVLVNLFHFTMLLVPLADNLIVVWIAIELTTVGSAFLIVHEGRKSSWEATWKYLIVTSTGIILAFLGTIFLANSIPHNLIEQVIKEANPNKLLDWSFLMNHSQELNSQFVWFAFLFALIGYGTKAGLFPMQTWLPDGHGEAPAPISALLSGVLLPASLYALLRFFTLTNARLGAIYSHWTSYAFVIAGLLSLLAATPFVLKRENPFKRVLAYSSVEHMGIIMLGIGMGGMITSSGAILHMLSHAVTKALLFISYGNVVKKHQQEKKIMQGVFRSMPWSGGMLTLSGIGLSGIPALNVFLSEFVILYGILSRLFKEQVSISLLYTKPVVITVAFLFLVSTTLISFGLLYHLRKIVLGKPDDGFPREKFRWQTIGPLLFLFTLMLLLGIWLIPPLSHLVSESARVVLGQ